MASEDEDEKFRQVQMALKEQCEQKLNATPLPDSPFCAGFFDNWTCWMHTPAGKWDNQSCPEFIVGFDPHRQVYRECEENGEWYYHPRHNKTWANYTSCVNIDDLHFQQHINLLYTVGYSISLIALVVSLALLTYFKSLRCARITVHMNLFASFAVNNTLWLLWYNLVLGIPDVLYANPVWCRLLHIVLYYFLISNYSWMLCEGVYLHTVLVSAFIMESRLLRYMLILGWGVPGLTIAIYASVRQFAGDAEETSMCWMNDGKYNIILQIPVCVTISLNVIFLFNIVRVLLIKLRKGPQVGGGSGGAAGASRTSLQALRATLLLVPLLGLNFLLTPFRPEPNHPFVQTYEVLSAITASLQGLCVAIMFCFYNGEVIAQVKRKWRTIMDRPRANSCTVTTVSVRKFVKSTAYHTGNGGDKV